VLLESKFARDNHSAQLNHDCVTEILKAVKSIHFSIWCVVGLAATDEVGEFYKASLDTIRSTVKVQSHRLCTVVAGGFTLIYDELYEQGHFDQKEFRRLSDALGEAV